MTRPIDKTEREIYYAYCKNVRPTTQNWSVSRESLNQREIVLGESFSDVDRPTNSLCLPVFVIERMRVYLKEYQ